MRKVKTISAELLESRASLLEAQVALVECKLALEDAMLELGRLREVILTLTKSNAEGRRIIDQWQKN